MFCDWRRLLLVCAGILGTCGTAAADAPFTFPAATARLEAALDSYRAIADQGGWPTIPDGPALRIGMSGPDVALLKQRLAATGDLTDQRDGAAEYDAVVESAVMQFQARHGLEPDGVVGRKTRAALNVPVDARIQQFTANLARLRSLPLGNAKRSILVNVAGFDLTVFEDGKAVFASPVIVGRLSRPTPVFSSAITRVIVNPYWHVPRRIAVNDLLPKIKEDPSYISTQAIRVYRASDSSRIEVPPETVDWKSLNSRNFPFRLVQDPGPANALGRVKFYLPNDFDIYLHDTPARELFNQDRRAFSSGCIRVGKALELAEFLLRRDGSGSFRALAEGLQGHGTRQIDLATPVPLHIVYLTAWADPSGRAQFRDDVYRLDNLIIAKQEQQQAIKRDVAMAYDMVPLPACTVASG